VTPYIGETLSLVCAAVNAVEPSTHNSVAAASIKIESHFMEYPFIYSKSRRTHLVEISAQISQLTVVDLKISRLADCEGQSAGQRLVNVDQ